MHNVELLTHHYSQRAVGPTTVVAPRGGALSAVAPCGDVLEHLVGVVLH